MITRLPVSGAGADPDEETGTSAHRAESGDTIPPSLDLIYDLITGRIVEQNTQIAALDGKANFGLGSATLLITAATGLRAGLVTARQAGRTGDITVLSLAINPTRLVDWLTLGAFVAYLLVITCAYNAYALRRYTIVPEPEPLQRKYMGEPAHKTKETVVAGLTKAFGENEALVGRKVAWTRWALRALFLEALLLLLMTVVQLAL